MKYAVIVSGNKQYKVSEGDIIEVQRLPLQSQEGYTFTDVLLYVDGSDRKVGTPLLSGIVVSGGIVANIKGKKIRVAKFKAKSRYRRVMGFRPFLTQVKIEKISVNNQDKSPKKSLDSREKSL